MRVDTLRPPPHKLEGTQMNAMPRSSAVEADPRWSAVVAKDAKADGIFWYSVRTTGVYCRPSCGARLPRPENIDFHASRADAEKAGYRPCKRCKPEQASLAERHATLILAACRRIENADGIPSLEAIATQADMSPHHFHRVFKAVTGVTPKAYAMAHRAQRVRDELHRRTRITDAIFDAGYNSNTRFYERSNALLGMTPSKWRRGGQGADIRFAIGECSLGAILVACSAKGVCSIQIDSEPDLLVHNLQDRFPNARLIGNDDEFTQLVARVIGFVEAPRSGFELPLDIRGTAFQQRVWDALRRVPAGSTASYRDIAERIGAPKAVRAVARACAQNEIAVAIPCHRIVRTDGALSGYRWGVERKQVLLERERNKK